MVARRLLDLLKKRFAKLIWWYNMLLTWKNIGILSRVKVTAVF